MIKVLKWRGERECVKKKYKEKKNEILNLGEVKQTWIV